MLTLIYGFRVIYRDTKLEISCEAMLRPNLTINVSIPYDCILEHLLESSYGRIHSLEITNHSPTIYYRIRG